MPRPPLPLVVLDLDEAGPSPALLADGAVVVGRSASEHPRDAAACDVLLDPDDGDAFDAITATVDRNPLAAVALVELLRGGEGRSVDDGLNAESAAYSSLQAGPEFALWRASRPARERRPEGDPVLLERSGAVLRITLDRPHVRNALNSAMRDALVEAFALPTADPSISEVHLSGRGEAFCAGGDLDEFGTFPDPVTAHVIRLRQSVGRAIDAVRDRVTVHLHGACVGSGIELPAFAGRIIAAEDTRISLPEIALGLVPGAGGTVSLPRRIGRHRTARLALTGEQLDARTALAWGLVDEVVPS